MSDGPSSAHAEAHMRLDGVFDAMAAWNLRNALAALPNSARVVLDFSKVTEFYDFGVAILAHGLAVADRPRVTMRGLRTHQHRMFRYFGIDPDAEAPEGPSGGAIAAAVVAQHRAATP
jgi:hypothetical protein